MAHDQWMLFGDLRFEGCFIVIPPYLDSANPCAWFPLYSGVLIKKYDPSQYPTTHNMLNIKRMKNI